MLARTDQEISLMLVMPEAPRLEQSQAVGRLQEQLNGRLISEGFKEVAASLKRVREDTRTQDLGVTLGIVLASPALVTVAKGIADFIRGLAPKATLLEIGCPNGTKLRIESRSAEEIEAALHTALRKP
jgi:hypothetical protein